MTDEDLDRMAEEVEHAEIDPEQFLKNAWIAPRDELGRHLSAESVQALEKLRRGARTRPAPVRPISHPRGSRQGG